MLVDEMKIKKRELGYSNKKLSELSGVPVGTIQKIFSGETKTPRFETLLALSDALQFWELRDSVPAARQGLSQEEIRKIKEDIFENNRKKTVDDYLAIPDGVRVELIDGQFYDMAAPTTIHQQLAMKLSIALDNYKLNNNGKCMVFSAPTDVQLDEDDKTMVQPDVFIVCSRDKIIKARIKGAPDMVIEIVSPSDVFKDVLIKMLKYKKAGVKEYWIVFPENLGIMVYEFTKSDEPVSYTFNDKVPVGIWGGKCKIDFKEIYKQIEFLYK